MAGEVFPRDEELERLRDLVLQFQEAYRELTEFGRWLRAVKDSWPTRRAEFEAEYRERRIRLREKLEWFGRRVQRGW